ncbi:DMT family transporter [Paracoccus zhejiangensis]|uniref:Multidrug DMT transporter permease n=1 Tax=Paracoccus zhejiangensis TaxID=1077935 RepID=A0A2H5EX46_9RHOB|nr:DMT family transporter [Paracoccus zhejiangensis]AUH63857.1 multidrug DMT transporter permease [Paracoccus zhejiangensis]
MLWIATTLIAALAQTGRNAAQAGLTGRIGTAGATAVRFIFGLPFAALALAIAALLNTLPAPGTASLAWAVMGAVAQMLATGFLLLAMQGRGFGIATALSKTEPVTLALIGAMLLAEPLGWGRIGAIATAVLGVLLVSGADWSRAGLRSVFDGVMAGALFGLSAIGFRGAILALPEGGFVLRALTILTLTLAVQTVLALVWLSLFDRKALSGIIREWRGSLAAGALGAFASLFWFTGFALTSAANVRTLALIEVPFAQLVSGRVFRQRASARQLAGMGLIVAGVGWLLWVAI